MRRVLMTKVAVPVLASSGSIALAGLLGKPWDSTGPRSALRSSTDSSGRAPWAVSRSPTSRATRIGKLVLSATINGIAVAPFLAVIMVISGSRKLLGDYRNGPLATVVGWATVAIMTVAGAAALYIAIAHPH